LLFSLLSLMMLFNTIIYTSSGIFDLINLTTADVSGALYLYNGIICTLLSNCLIIILIPLFRIKNETREKLLEVVKSGQQLKLLYDWEVLNKQNKISCIVGVSINIILMLFAAYFTFSFCAVISTMRSYILIGWCISIMIDMILFEMLMELFCFAFFAWKSKPFFK
jgi:hypothetical protein